MSLVRPNRADFLSKWALHAAFAFGVAVGFLCRGWRGGEVPLTTSSASSVAHLSQLSRRGVSHNPDIEKVVLADNGELPHVTQVAIATLRPGQIASRNHHKDMAELFYFLGGNGIVELGTRNHTVTAGSIVKAFPPTPHTIWNVDRSQPLVLLTVASV